MALTILICLTLQVLKKYSFVPGLNSIWRDIKTYGHYAYVTTEAYNGLLIIDLSNLPDSTNTNTYIYSGPSSNSMLEISLITYLLMIEDMLTFLVQTEGLVVLLF